MGRTILPFVEEEIFLPRGSPCDLPPKVEISTFTFKSVRHWVSLHTLHCMLIARVSWFSWIMYQVVGFGRGDGRHSGRHRRSVVQSVKGDGAAMIISLNPDYSTSKTYSCRNLYETCMSIQKCTQISAEVLHQAITDKKNRQHYKYATRLYMYVLIQNGSRKNNLDAFVAVQERSSGAH